MLAGEVPFDGPSSQSILVQHLTKTMPAIGTKRPGVNHALAKVVARCTEKKPENRYAGAAEVAEALRAVAPSGAASGRPDRGRLVLGAVVVAAAVLVAGGGWLAWRALHRTAAAPAAAAAGGAAGGDRLAVLPFDVMGDPDPTLPRMTAQLLATAVDRRYQLPAVDPRGLFGRWADEKLTPLKPLTDLAEFAGGLGAGQMALGSAVVAGGQLRLSVTVYDTKAQTRLSAGEVTGQKDDVMALADRLAEFVAETRCSEPDFNPQNVCFDVAPRLPRPVTVTVTDSLARAATAPSYWIRVSKSGGYSDGRVRRSSSSDSVDTAGLVALQVAEFVPATKGGKVVEAWMPVSVTLRRP
jgi:TolB-like protein